MPYNYFGPEEMAYIDLGVFFDPTSPAPDATTAIIGTRARAHWRPTAPVGGPT